MKVIFLKDILPTAMAGDVKEVKDQLQKIDERLYQISKQR